MSPLSSSQLVSLDNFEGTLDLLLYLIQRSEIDIYDIPIRQITEQYWSYLKELESKDVDSGSEFLSHTANLLLIKSRTLLPPREQSEELEEEKEEDPRFELLHQLVEYCQFKLIAQDFSQREDLAAHQFYRGCDQGTWESPKPLGLKEVTLQDLAVLLDEALVRAARREGLVEEERWRVSDKLKELHRILKTQPSLHLRTLFDAGKSRNELIVTFLALLEMMKIGEILVGRREEDDELVLCRPGTLSFDQKPQEEP